MTVRNPTLEALSAAISAVPSASVFSVQQSLSAAPLVAGAKVLSERADPFEQIVSSQDAELSSVVIYSLQTLFASFIHITSVSSPLVVHLAIDFSDAADFGLLSALRHSGFHFLQSFDAQDTYDTAIAASLYAKRDNKPVIHFFSYLSNAPTGTSFKQVSADKVASSFASLEKGANPFSIVKKLSGRSYGAFEYIGPANASQAVVVLSSATNLFKSAIEQASKSDVYSKTGLVIIRKYVPFSYKLLAKELPSSVKSLALAEQVIESTTSWTSLFQDVIASASSEGLISSLPSLVSIQLAHIQLSNVSQALTAISVNLSAETPVQKLLVGNKYPEAQLSKVAADAIAQAKTLESAYTRVLVQNFKDKLSVINADGETTGFESTPEYGFGKFLATEHSIEDLQSLVREGLADIKNAELQTLLTKWLVNRSNGEEIAKIIKDSNSAAPQLAKYADLFPQKSNWIIGSDAWAYDLGSSGVHHVLSSGKNVNMLVIDSKPHSIAKEESSRRKKDIGLYAMNFGNVYVASVAVYASYTQLLQALTEASAFDGPSVVVAYLPYYTEADSALTVLQETKKGVDTGYWPLYRYDPSAETSFKLDSYQIRQALKDFLERENQLTLLSNKSPAFARNLEQSQGSLIKQKQKKRADDAYALLLEGLQGPPLTVLYASDGGQAESAAKRLARRAKSRGLKSEALPMDDYTIEEFANATNVVFITSTAGQGELPQNGRVFWEALKGATDLDLSEIAVSVFGMGDSLYWPRKEDAHYYNKPSKDLWKRLTALNAKILAPLGQGDDQGADGWATGYNEWEPEVWKTLGVEGAAADEPPPITNEDIKIGSNYLRGTIAEGLKDKSTGAISASDQQLTKFHGIYMQDDRDVRDDLKDQGLEPAYSFMVRVRLPGCVATPEQWLKMDHLANTKGNNTFKLTTRGTFQLHGVIKENLKPAIRGINSACIDTVAACGDVDRNVVAAALPENKKIHSEVVKIADSISEHLLPETTAYHEIWLEGADPADEGDYQKIFESRKAGPKKKKTLVSGSTLVDHEPLYGPTYLPRKFKINIAVPPHNDVDVYGHDIGLIAIVVDNELLGFNVLVGGGMGTTHNNKKTYPRTGSCLGFVTKDKIETVCEKVMLVQRDNGDRTNRKHARLKYTVDDMTVDGFKKATEALLGFKFEPERPFKFDSNTDQFGWVRDETGLHHFTAFIENGRVEDTADFQFMTCLRKIAEYLKDNKVGSFRLTANQHVLISDIPEEHLQQVKDLLKEYKLDNVNFSGLRLSSAACVAFPTCGLAMAESERYLPELVTKLESALEEYGLRHDSIVMRMTGCPNGCARPWLAEVALVGKAYGAYNLMLGGGHHGQRLNKLYRSSIKEDEILSILKPLFKRWALERTEGEKFGDFLIRTGVIHETTHGTNFWDNVPGED